MSFKNPAIRRVALATAAFLLAPRLAAACPVCFGAADGPMLRGSNMGILTLLIVTLCMFAAFGAFFVHLARKSAAQSRQETSAASPQWQGEPTR